MEAKLAFGERLRAWRKSRKMTQESLAQSSGMHRMAIAKIEAGTRGKAPAWDTVQKLSEALGISAESLTGSMPTEPAKTATAAPKPKPASKKKA